MDEKDVLFIWQMITVVFSVSLYFSAYIAHQINLFKPGNFYYYVLRISTPNWDEIKSTILYVILLTIDILGIGFIYKNWDLQSAQNFYINLLIGIIIGVSPMFAHYITLRAAETYYPQIIQKSRE